MHISYIIDMFRRENAPGEKQKERRTYFENLSPTKPLLAWALTKVFSLPQERHLHCRRPLHDPQREVKIRSSETHMTYDEYIAQEQSVFSGSVLVPDDLERIDL